ncbi:MAG: RagB/SusD family nutrient uptake outer membrane protein [Tannerellaceae bacterium]|jgi:hypothetical protein|nr:RagB/SusD family nutrient uptake outer membrane protein [Tannerellaceae bacterium]
MKKIIYIVMAAGCFFSCDLDEAPLSKVSKEPIFTSESGLELYANSFYNILPSASDAIRDAFKNDNMADYSAMKSVSNFLREGAYGPQQSGRWDSKENDDNRDDWGKLRSINYFLENCTNEEISETIRNNYIGIARFFRAFFYFEKVKRFGDVPWIDKPLSVDDPALYAGRDSRELVMDKVLEDLNYACEHITTDTDPTCSMITKYAALAFKSRVCLFEGTFRKYHTSYNLSASADTWIREAADAAERVMKESGYTIYMGAGESMSYRELFINQKPLDTEIILASVCDPSLSVYNDANWWWTSSTYGSRVSLIRTFVNTYLMLDGTPFTDKADYKTMVLSEEVTGRDKRLEQTIRTNNYQRVDGGTYVAAPPLFSYTYTGYQPIKFCLDDMYYDSGANNINSIPLIRYAEVLLNYAEAKAELGTFTDADWQNTIGLLRKRAGITGGLDAKPSQIDPYLQANYFPEIADPALLEIRRERGIELVFEGLRFFDLIRWRKGNLMEIPWNGFYVPALDVPMDLNADGIMDVCFTYEEEVKNPVAGVVYINVAPMRGGVVNPQRLSENTKGELTWLTNIEKKWQEKNYLYPIPESALLMNSNLGQNPGW